MKICIFGGGAIGGVIAGRLARAGLCEISLVARGKTLDAIRKNGLRVLTSDGDFTADIHATDNPAELGPQDYVIVTTKAHQLDDAYASIGPLLGENTTVIPPTAGIPYWFFYRAQGQWRDRQMALIDPDGRNWATVHPERVIGCVYWIGAHVVEPGVLSQDGAKGGCPLGEPDGSSSERVQRLSDILIRSGIPAPIRADIRGEIWTKAMNSLCWNPVACLTMATLGEIAAAPEVVEMVRTMMQEADDIARDLEIRVPYPPEKRINLTLSATAHKMSMLQDLEAGRSLELDVLDRSIRAVRALAGRPTPTIDAVMALIKLRAATLFS